MHIFYHKVPDNTFLFQPNNLALLARYDTSYLVGNQSSIKLFKDDAHFLSPMHYLTNCFAKVLKLQNVHKQTLNIL